MNIEHQPYFDASPDNLLNAVPASVDRPVLVEMTPGVQEYRRESQLVRKAGEIENDREVVRWVEYYLPGDTSRPVHRSAHVHLKQPTVFGEGAVASIG